MALEREIRSVSEAEQPAAPEAQGGYRWYHVVASLLFILFCLDLGMFLLVFPWLSEYWDHNFFSTFVPEWHRFWDSSYVRGAVSGLGVVNLYISFIEILRLRRFARRQDED